MKRYVGYCFVVTIELAEEFAVVLEVAIFNSR
jgi:hypothetical protein